MPTAPMYGDMRADLTLNVTLDVPTTVEGVEERESTQPAQNIERGSLSNVATPVTKGPEMSPKVIQGRPSQEEIPGSNEVMKYCS